MDRMLEQPTSQRAIVSFLLDRTGSMADIKDETIGGFNAYLDALERDISSSSHCCNWTASRSICFASAPSKRRIIVAFQTDGEENASREHTLDVLRELIERREAEGRQFILLGADSDAYARRGCHPGAGLTRKSGSWLHFR
jgi:hypothetical protein